MESVWIQSGELFTDFYVGTVHTNSVGLLDGLYIREEFPDFIDGLYARLRLPGCVHGVEQQGRRAVKTKSKSGG